MQKKNKHLIASPGRKTQMIENKKTNEKIEWFPKKAREKKKKPTFLHQAKKDAKKLRRTKKKVFEKTEKLIDTSRKCL